MTNIIKNILIFYKFILLSLVTVLIVLWTFSNSIPDYRFLKTINRQFQAKCILEMEI